MSSVKNKRRHKAFRPDKYDLMVFFKNPEFHKAYLSGVSLFCGQGGYLKDFILDDNWDNVTCKNCLRLKANKNYSYNRFLHFVNNKHLYKIDPEVENMVKFQLDWDDFKQKMEQVMAEKRSSSGQMNGIPK